MKRWIVVFLAACGGKQQPPQRACLSFADAHAQVEASVMRNRGRLIAKLAERDVSSFDLTPTRENRTDDSATWRIEPRDDGTTILTSPTGSVSCGRMPEYEFVKNAQSEVWVLVPAPSKLGATRAVDTCACRSEQPTTCGGAAPPPVQLVFTLPAGLTFRGDLLVEYDAEDTWVVYADQYPGSRCPPMPPPPP